MTSVVIKPCDRLVWTHLNHMADHLQDPQQFTTYAVQEMHVQARGYMEGSGLVVDFSSAFAALIHELLHTKLSQLTMAASTCHGISSSLKGRREQMRLGKA